MQFADVVLQKQDSLGLKTWASYAADAGVENLTEISNCVAQQVPRQRIERHQALGKSLGITATPTVIVNGWRYPIPPDSVELERILAVVSAGKEMFK